MVLTQYHLSGTKVNFYGHSSGGGSLALILDGRNMNVPLNSTKSANRPSLIFSSDNMEDGDHQLYGELASLQVNGSLAVDYFECVAPLLYPTSRNGLMTILSLEGLKICPEGALVFSAPVEMQRTYPKKQSLWMILARKLSFTMPPSGFMDSMSHPTCGLGRTRTQLVHR